ncbi:MAG TPA: hypothetical protein VHF25_00685, partial [Nitriliruptorales bacterium]|nr:hypothetical protein [Nitriliruptorales bacterium]
TAQPGPGPAELAPTQRPAEPAAPAASAQPPTPTLRPVEPEPAVRPAEPGPPMRPVEPGPPEVAEGTVAAEQPDEFVVVVPPTDAATAEQRFQEWLTEHGLEPGRIPQDDLQVDRVQAFGDAEFRRYRVRAQWVSGR